MEDRDFIDFEFNGHWASEFNLLAVSNSDRYSNSFYGTVNANTADMVGKYGVYKWKTQIGEKRFSINIAYDNVDLNTLRKIKEWLNPFVIGKLVFKEEPYKYYWVSLAEDPEISFLPFLTEETVVDGRRLKKGVYKGEFVINFVCFDNYGYSDWNSFDENYDYIVKELEISDDEVNFDDGSDNSLIISQIDGNLKQNKESQAYYSTSQESNSLTLNDITNTDTEKWNIKGGNSQVVQNYNSTRVESESFDLNDVDNSKTMDIQLKGNHSQETREGYNLLENKSTTQTKNGVTITKNTDGTLVVKGTATSDFTFLIASNITLENGKKYRLSGCPAGGDNKKYALTMNQYYENQSHYTQDYGSGSLFTYNELSANTNSVYIRVIKDVTYNNLIFKPMIIAGESTKEYEQYGATPSLKFPSEIKAVGSNINLLNNTLQSQTINGLTVTVNEDKSVKVVGTATSNTNIIFDRHDGKLAAGTYTLKDCRTFIESTENQGWWQEGQTRTFTSEATLPNNGIFKYYSANTAVNETLYPMLAKGTIVTSYAQYKQGSANVVVCNENLFKETSNNKKTNTAYGYLISGNYMLKKGKKYAVSFDTNNNGGKVYLNEYVLKFIGSTYDAACDGKRHTIIATAIVDGYQNNRNLIKTGVATTDYYDVSNISVCEYVNNSSSDFVEHQEQTITMPVQQEMLKGDYFNFDKEKEIHNWVKLILDGTEDWNLDNTYQGICQYSFQSPKSAIYNDNTKNIESNYFRGVAFQPDSWKKDNCITMYTTSNVRYIRIMTSRYKTVDEFKALLKEKHDAGNPVIIYYKLETPIELNFTEKQKAVAKQFKAITPYKNITHIYSTDEITPKMVIDYNITRAMPSLDYPSEVETVGGNINIFNKNDVMENAYLNSANGSTLSSSTSVTSNYIEINSNSNYVINGYGTNNYYKVVCYYDKNKNFISSITRIDTRNELEISAPDGACYLRFHISKNSEEVKLEKGSIATPYSKYGMGSVEIDVVNKNLFPSVKSQSVESNGIALSYNADTQEFHAEGTTTSTNFYCNMRCGEMNFLKANKNYIFSVNNSMVEKCLFQITRANVGNNGDIQAGEKSVTIVNLDKYIPNSVMFYSSNIEIGTKISYTFKVQIEEGTTATDIVEHQSQSYIMPIQQDMLEGDYFDFDREKEIHDWNLLSFTGNEAWSLLSGATSVFLLGNVSGQTYGGHNFSMCTHFKYDTRTAGMANLQDETFAMQYEYSALYVKCNKFTTVEEWKAYLKSQYENGTPIKLAYITANITELSFTNEQKIVARQLKRSNFYKGTTNVILDNDLAKVKVNYDGYDGAPSEKHPSSVDGVKDSVEITVKNKNILPIPNSSNTSMGLTSTYSNGVYQITGTPVTNWTFLFQKLKQPIKKGKYTLSYEVEGEKYQLEPTFIYKNGEVERKWLQPSIKKQTIDLKDDVESLTLGLSGFTINQAVNITLKIQLERGEEATEIVVPEQQKVSLPVQEEMYIGDYIDEIGEHHKMTKIIIDGTNTRVSMTKRGTNFIQTFLNISEQFDPQVDIKCYSNIMNQEYNGRFGFVNTFIKSKTGIYFHFKGDLLGDADCNDVGINNWFKEQYDKGTPAYIIGPLKKEKMLPLTDEQKSALNILKNYTYSYPGANTISISGDTKPKITASYIPQQDINIDFILEGSNLLNDSAFYYNNDIYLKAFDEIDSGNPSTSGISSEREVYLYNAGNADASLKLTFDLIIPAENSPLTIVTSKGHFTKNGFEEINSYSQFSISNFAHYKPFVDIFDGVLSNWVIEIDSDLCEVYLKHKTNKDKVISLNRFNDNQSFLKLAGSDFVDYSKSFPTSLEEIKDSAIENTIFNKISLKESAQNYRLKNVSLDWKHTYL